LDWKQGDLVGNGERVGEGWHVLASAREAEDHVAGVVAAQLRLALLANDGQVGFRGVGEHLADLSRQARVDTTAEALVGAAYNDEGLLSFALDGLGFGALEDGVGRLAVLAGLGHGTGGAGELGRGDDLHRLGNLLDVADRLEAALDFAQGGVAGGIGGNEGSGPAATGGQ